MLAGFALGALVLLVLSLISVPIALIVADPDPRTWSFLIAVALTAVGGYGVVQFARSLSVGSPALLIDGHGIWDRRTAKMPIPWDAIRAVRFEIGGLKDFAVLEVMESRPTVLKRLVGRFFPLPSTRRALINLNLLSAGRDPVIEAIDRLAPPGLIGPRPAPQSAKRRGAKSAAMYALSVFVVLLAMLFIALTPQLIAGAYEKMGRFYDGRPIGSADRREQLAWYRRAVEWGSTEPRVLIFLATRYESGEGIGQDYAEVARLYHLFAFHHRSIVAQRNLGRLYEEGLGVPRDLDKAKGWTRTAAIRGDKEALARWARLAGSEPVMPQIPNHTPP